MGCIHFRYVRLCLIGQGRNHTEAARCQILFARMGITLLLCLFYMWWRGIQSAPFGPKPVRKLLVARGFGGFFGAYGMYYSLQYLPIGT